MHESTELRTASGYCAVVPWGEVCTRRGMATGLADIHAHFCTLRAANQTQCGPLILRPVSWSLFVQPTLEALDVFAVGCGQLLLLWRQAPHASWKIQQLRTQITLNSAWRCCVFLQELIEHLQVLRILGDAGQTILVLTKPSDSQSAPPRPSTCLCWWLLPSLSCLLLETPVAPHRGAGLLMSQINASMRPVEVVGSIIKLIWWAPTYDIYSMTDNLNLFPLWPLWPQCSYVCFSPSPPTRSHGNTHLVLVSVSSQPMLALLSYQTDTQITAFPIPAGLLSREIWSLDMGCKLCGACEIKLRLVSVH